MKKTGILALITAVTLSAAAISGCGKADKADEAEIPKVQLSVWTSEDTKEFCEGLVTAFADEHKDEIELKCTVSVEGENTCRDTVLGNPEGAADIYTYASDQFDDLLGAGALLEITENAESIIEGVGGKDSAPAEMSMSGKKLYAYPLTAGNGYFLYYNTAYLSDADAATLEGILDKAAAAGKKFSFDMSSGWYTYSFFKAAGFDIRSNSDNSANICDWNGTSGDIAGTDVLQKLLDIAAHDGFTPGDDEAFLEGVENGTIIAGVNGAWNSEKVAEAWGDDYAAAKLPVCEIAGHELQMCSFTGCKLVSVNAYTEEPEWSMKLAEYLTNEQNQLKRFELTGECPANVNAANSAEVQKAPAVAALAAQSQYGHVQNVASQFWDAANKLGITVLAGNPDHTELQALLDEMVAEATAPGV